MADDQALQGPHPHLANGSRGRSNLLPYQPHGFTIFSYVPFPLPSNLLWGYVADNEPPKNDFGYVLAYGSSMGVFAGWKCAKLPSDSWFTDWVVLGTIWYWTDLQPKL